MKPLISSRPILTVNLVKSLGWAAAGNTKKMDPVIRITDNLLEFNNFINALFNTLLAVKAGPNKFKI